MPKKRSTATWAGIPDYAPSASGLKGHPYVRRCSAMNRRYERCGCPSVRGKLVCRKHGGRAGRKPKTGLYSFNMARLGEEIKQKFKRHMEREDVTSLHEEIALARAYFEGFLAQITPADSEDPPPLTSEILKTFLGFLSRIARLAKSQAEIQWGPQHLITASQAMTFYRVILEGVRRHVTDVGERERLFEYVESTLGLAGLEEK